MKTFKEIQYKRLDYSLVKKELKDVTKRIKAAKDYEHFKKYYFEAESIIANVYTINSLVSIRFDVNMNDAFYEKEKKYNDKNSAKLQLTQASLFKTILKSKFRKDFDNEFGSFLTKKIEYELKLVNLFSIIDSIKESNLINEYSKAVATCKTDFYGEECNFYGLLKHMQSTNRHERKEAFEKWANLYEGVSEKLDSIYDQLVKIRVKIAKELGYKNYIDFIYLKRQRFDYTKEDIEQFRNNVKEIIVPLCVKLFEKQKERIGVEQLCYYDESLSYSLGNPIPDGNKEQLVQYASEMYHQLSAETGEYFNFMVEHQLFDLETKPGKRLGGYCTFLPNYKAPFIFSNFNGTSADVDVLTHEAGHAFQVYLASREQRNMLSISSTSEINEIHSMSMEHFTYPYMDKFFNENADLYRYHHLYHSVLSIPYLVSVDEFQHRVFENPSMNSAERREVWHNIEKTYMPWRNYDGNSFLKEGGFWMQKQHIFMYPFYYVDYALAQVCAYQFFIRSLEDKELAFKDYITFCKMGGSLGYFELLDKANLENPFKKETMQKTIDKLAEVIDEFEKKIY